MTTEETEIAVIKNQIKTIFDHIKDDKIRKNIYVSCIAFLLVSAIGANLYIGRKLGGIDIHIDQSVGYINTVNKLDRIVPTLEGMVKNNDENYHEIIRKDSVQDEKISSLEEVVFVREIYKRKEQ